MKRMATTRPLSAVCSLVAACSLAIALTACASGGTAESQAGSSDPSPSPSTSSSSSSSPSSSDAGTPSPRLTVSDIRFGDREWWYSPNGVELPISITLVDGTATVDSVTYTLGKTVTSDANGDGMPDVATEINRADGNGFETLWYIWVIDTSAADAAQAATQIPYPIAHASRCGDTINSVGADPSGFIVDEALRLPWTDDALPCSEPGTGVRTRTIGLTTDGNGGYFPVQLTPIAEWGGVCPGSQWLDGAEETDELRSAPADSAPIAVGQGTRSGGYELNPAPQLEALRSSDWMFVGFSTPDDPGVVRLHCGFLAHPAG